MKRFWISFRFGLIFTISSLLLACAGTSPKEHLYTLSTISVDQAPALDTPPPSRTAPLRIQIMPISIDETVDRPQIVITRSQRQVSYLEQQRWAQPLKYEIGRVLALYLQAPHYHSLVSAYPHQLSDVDIQVHLQVTAFESSYDDGARLDVNMSITNTRSKQRYSEVVSVTHGLDNGLATQGIPALIAAHNHNLSHLSQKIALGIQQVR